MAFINAHYRMREFRRVFESVPPETEAVSRENVHYILFVRRSKFEAGVGNSRGLWKVQMTKQAAGTTSAYAQAYAMGSRRPPSIPTKTLPPVVGDKPLL